MIDELVEKLNDFQTEYSHLTPGQLADALESGDYKHVEGHLGTAKRNCCLGVYARELGIEPKILNGEGDLNDLSNRVHYDWEQLFDELDMELESGDPIEVGIEFVDMIHLSAPWMRDSLNGNEVQNLLMQMNDGVYDNIFPGPEIRKKDRWPMIIVPFLRALKVNKNGHLSKVQTAAIQNTGSTWQEGPWIQWLQGLQSDS